MIIVGYRTIRKILTSWQGPCCSCGQPANQALYRDMKWFTLFWLPIFPVYVTRRIYCATCGVDIKVNKAQAESVVHGVEAAQVAGQVPMVHPFVEGYIGSVPVQS